MNARREFRQRLRRLLHQVRCEKSEARREALRKNEHGTEAPKRHAVHEGDRTLEAPKEMQSLMLQNFSYKQAIKLLKVAKQ